MTVEERFKAEFVRLAAVIAQGELPLADRASPPVTLASDLREDCLRSLTGELGGNFGDRMK